MRHRNDKPGQVYCGKKVRYDKKGATTAKNLRQKFDKSYLRIYECYRCGGWHLTHKEYWFEEEKENN